MSDVTELNRSRVAQVAALEVGESWSKAVRVSPEDLGEGVLAGHLRRMREDLSAVVRRATAKSSNNYVIESVHTATLSGAMIALVVVTRVADDI